MKNLAKTFIALTTIIILTACGGGGSSSDTSSTGNTNTTTTTNKATITSISVDGTAFPSTAPITVKNGQVVTVSTSSAVNFSATSTLNGVSTPTVLAIKQIGSTTWSSIVNSAPGSVVTLVITDSSTSANVATLTFNIQSAYQGTWSITFGGSDSGNCTALPVSTVGTVSGNCTSALVGAFSVAGSISATGAATIKGTATTGATFTGQFSATTASGTWVNGGASGNWSATKN